MHKMRERRVSYVFFFFAFAITVGTVGADQKGDVSISGTTVTLTCPLEDNSLGTVIWNPTKNNHDGSRLYIIENYNNKNDGLYSCTYDSITKHYFYIKAKVCDGCVDMDMSIALVAIFGDVLITAGVVLMVYFCARKKGETAAPRRATQPRQARGQARGPTPPDPDYQPLNPATRSNDVYAHAQRR